MILVSLHSNKKHKTASNSILAWKANRKVTFQLEKFFPLHLKFLIWNKRYIEKNTDAGLGACPVYPNEIDTG